LGLSNDYIAKKLNITKGRVIVLINNSYRWFRANNPMDSNSLSDYPRVREETLERIEYLNHFLDGKLQVNMGGYDRQEYAQKIMNLVFLIENGRHVHKSFKFELLKTIEKYESITKLMINQYYHNIDDKEDSIFHVKHLIKHGYIFRASQMHILKNQTFTI
jgi:hypothetical protein